MSTDYRALCAELLAALDRQAATDPEADGGLLRHRARAALAQPEPASQALADLAWPDPTTITPCGMAINGRMYRLTPMDEPEPRADGEVAELVTLIRQIALAWEPDACLLGNMTAGQLARAADLLESRGQPEPVGPTDEEITAWCWELSDLCRAGKSDEFWMLGDVQSDDINQIVRAALRRWGRPGITPIPCNETTPMRTVEHDGRSYLLPVETTYGTPPADPVEISASWANPQLDQLRENVTGKIRVSGTFEHGGQTYIYEADAFPAAPPSLPSR
jgi:hypothetical protein